MPGTYQYDVEIKSNVAKLLSDMKQVQDRLDTVEGKEYKIKLNVDEKKLSSVISNLEKMLDSLGKGTSDFKQFENLSKQLSSITTDIGKISKAFATMDDGSGLVNNIKSIDSSLTNLTNHFVLQVSDKMASSIKEVKGTLSDVGDGKELTPLLNTIGRIESAIDKLSSSVKGIGLNMNIDLGSDKEMEAKAEAKISNALQAYQRLFEHIKMSSAGGSIINTKFFDFDINQYDTAMSKLQAYRKFIENMRNETKAMYGGQDVLFTDTDKKYWTQASSAMGQVTKTFNEMKATSDTNPLENIFGKTDLTEVLNHLSAIVSKLDEISMSANRFADVFKDGLNVNASVEEIEKLTNRVKELESELAKIKTPTTVATPQESNISSGMKDTFPKTSENLEQVAQSEQKVQQEAMAIQSKWEQAEKAIQNYMNAVTKLNNLKASDKSTGKKSYEIAGQIEEIEKLKKEAYDARQVLSSMINPQNVDTDTWKRYVDVINRLDQASNGSAESVNRLKDSLKNTLNSELNSLQNSIDKYQNIITQAQTYPSDFHPSTEYNTKLANLDNANNALKDYKASLQGVTELTKEQQNQINRLTQNCEKAATEFKNLSAAEKGTIKVGVEKAIQRINKDLAENTKYSAEAKAGLNALLEQLKSGDPSINLRKITEEIIKIENAEIAAGRAGKSLWDIFKTKSTYGFIGQMQSYLSMYVGFYGMINGVKKAVSTIIELDTALVDLKKTTAMNENQLENFYYDSNNVAKQMGVTTKEIIDQASAWSRLGYNTAEASTEMAKLSSQFASISPGMSVDESQSGLVSIMKAWSINPDQVKSEIMDPINKLGKIIAQTYSNVWCYKNIA